MTMEELPVKLISEEEFLPFGEVIKAEEGCGFAINNGRATRYSDLAKVEAEGKAARVLVNIFRSRPMKFPYRITMMERHPFGSQAFLPSSDMPFLVVVARNDGQRPAAPQAFYCPPGVGVNYHKNIWHHPLLALFQTSDFYVIDRGGAENNLEEYFYSNQSWQISQLPDFVEKNQSFARKK